MDKKLNELKSYLDYEFSSGCYTGQDYKTFERKYINYLMVELITLYFMRTNITNPM